MSRRPRWVSFPLTVLPAPVPVFHRFRPRVLVVPVNPVLVQAVPVPVPVPVFVPVRTPILVPVQVFSPVFGIVTVWVVR
jgi:hypothetical protein